VAANEDVVPASELRAALQRVREPVRLVGKKAMEVEILQAARDEGKKSRVGTACPNDDRPEGGRDLPRPGGMQLTWTLENNLTVTEAVEADDRRYHHCCRYQRQRA
jgi:hypothetical protein